MAEKTIEKFLARAVRLYEQEQGEPKGSPLAWIVREAFGGMIVWRHSMVAFNAALIRLTPTGVIVPEKSVSRAQPLVA